jgi:hypothetical protein
MPEREEGYFEIGRLRNAIIGVTCIMIWFGPIYGTRQSGDEIVALVGGLLSWIIPIIRSAKLGWHAITSHRGDLK